MADVNGTVQSLSSTSGVGTVVVTYPGDPLAVPPVPPYKRTYDPVSGREWDLFLHADAKDRLVDCDGVAPATGAVRVHK